MVAVVVAVSEKQMAAFRADAETRFRARLVRWLGGNRDRIGRMDADHAECQTAADEAMRLCDLAGVSAEDDIASIALRRLQSRALFWTAPYAHVEAILADPSIPGERKLEEIRLRETLAMLAAEGP